MAHKNWARGSAPPSHSWEWVGVEKPPGTLPPVLPKKKPSETILVSESLTVLVEKKKQWPRLLLAGLIGGMIGYGAGSQRR